MDYIGFYTDSFNFKYRDSLTFTSGDGYDMGLSCGTYKLSLAKGNCISFLKKYFPSDCYDLYYNRYKKSKSYPGEEYASKPENIIAIWKYCYNKVGKDKFFEYEYEWMKENYYDKFKKQLSPYIDLDNTSRGLQECCWSWAIEKGVNPNSGAIHYFKNAIEGINLKTCDHEKIIDLIYDERLKANVLNKYKKGTKFSEREIIRALVSIKGIGVEVITSPNTNHGDKTKLLYRIYIGTCSKKSTAINIVSQINNKIDLQDKPMIIENGNLFDIVIRDYTNKYKAEDIQNKLKNKGIESRIIMRAE